MIFLIHIFLFPVQKYRRYVKIDCTGSFYFHKMMK